MKLNVLDINGKKNGDIEISDELFGKKINQTLVHQYVVSTLSNIRKGTRAQKNRSAIEALEESLGGKRVLEEPEQDQSEAQFGEVAEELFLQALMKTFIKKLTKKLEKLLYPQLFQKKLMIKTLL